ncbi:hypothetical protein [uncultured Aquimarina sp.]|uniref:hypothetical protein n=1 Tax=uncultured Aquimarina sp. TaxID=575652 RepID=UPI002612118A|nr:hypothetical protein [uncultured Aquimarina sp.]
MVRKIIFTLLTLTLICCKKGKIDEVIIGDTLLVHQSLSENRKLENLIYKSLEKDKNSIIELKNFPNGGAAGSYDLGYILTQIIYRIGENDFAKILKEIPKPERNGMEGLIAVGLEYGDNDYDGKRDNKKVESEFPILIEILNE